MIREDQTFEHDSGFLAEQPVSCRSAASTSLTRALAILELISHKPGGFSNAEISRRLQIATSTTSYILGRLEREGYLKRSGRRGRYEIGMKVIALAHGALRGMGLRRAAEPVMHRLAAETRHSTLIGVLERGLVMIVDKVEQPDLAPFDMDIGVRYPAHTTALGKVLLANLPGEALAHLLENEASGRLFARDASRRKSLLEELAQVRTQGFAISDGQLFVGVWVIAAPIFDASGMVRAAISLTGLPQSWTEQQTASAIVRSAHEISKRLIAVEQRKIPRS